MNSQTVPQIRKTLSTPLDFQEKFGDRPVEIAKQELPDDTWRGLSMHGWKFKEVNFKYTRFHADTFENVSFESCLFGQAEFKNCVFKNCTFRDAAVLSGSWEGCTFSGGSLEDLKMLRSPGADSPILWKDNRFEGVTLTGVFAAKQSGNWLDCRFSATTLSKSDLAVEFRSPTFRKSTLSEVSWHGTESGAAVLDGSFEECRFVGNEIGSLYLRGHFLSSKFEGGSNTLLGGSVEGGAFGASNGGVTLGKASHTTIEGGHTFAGMEQASDVVVRDIQGPSFSVAAGARGLTAERIRTETFSLENGTYERCTFRGIEAEVVDFSGAKFVDCAFEDVRITRRIYMNPQATFENCRFHKFQRAPGVDVHAYSNEPPIPYLFPFEASPGVAKP